MDKIKNDSGQDWVVYYKSLMEFVEFNFSDNLKYNILKHNLEELSKYHIDSVQRNNRLQEIVEAQNNDLYRLIHESASKTNMVFGTHLN